MALVKDSYKYHTRLDRAQYIERGALQHFGDNMLAILVHLAGTTTASELRNVTKARETVYFAMLGGRIFVCIQANYVLAGYAVLWLASVALIWTRMQKGRGAGYAVALVSIPGSLVSALVTANLTAVTMAYVLDEPLSYFRREWWSVLLYGVPTLLGAYFRDAQCQMPLSDSIRWAPMQASCSASWRQLGLSTRGSCCQQKKEHLSTLSCTPRYCTTAPLPWLDTR